ncbi:MAG: Na/Pi cotransporter family protein [Planctomycetota bacterium]|jgi:phosphate:Na+ symporter
MTDLAIGPLAMGLLGGLAVFLFGIEQMTSTLRSVAGTGLPRALRLLTGNRFTAAITGALMTTVVQSSSVTTVLVVSFISAGIMTLEQSIGVIMGANIGTTITAQVIAFKVTHYALVPITVGFALTFISQREALRQYGHVFMGLGFIFLGMGLMSEATAPLRSYQPFIDMMQRMDSPLLGIASAALFTAVVQSSSATTGIVIVLATQGFITIDAGIALAFGANIGTCVTAMLAALGKPRPAVQAAGVHLIFNVIGVMIWLPLIDHLAEMVVWLSPSHPDLSGTARLAAETPRQIANAHTVFNVANTLLMIGLSGPIALLVRRIIPDHVDVPYQPAEAKYLDPAYLATPALAIDGIRRESVRLGRLTEALMAEAPDIVLCGSSTAIDAMIERERACRHLTHHISEYTRLVAACEISSADSHLLAHAIGVTTNIQHVAETVAVELAAIGRERLHRPVVIGHETRARIDELARSIRDSFTVAIDALEHDDRSAAGRVIASKGRLRRQADDIIDHLDARLLVDEPDRAVLYRLESRMVELLLRQYYFAKRIAKALLIVEGDEQERSDDDGPHALA